MHTGRAVFLFVTSFLVLFLSFYYCYYRVKNVSDNNGTNGWVRNDEFFLF